MITAVEGAGSGFMLMARKGALINKDDVAVVG